MPSRSAILKRFFTKNRNTALFLALVLYGLFSSPTPDEISVFEYAIGGLLLTAIGAPALFGIFTGRYLFLSAKSSFPRKRESSPFSGSVSLDPRFHGDDGLRWMAWGFAVLFFIPLAVGVLAQHPVEDILRDIIPLGYFFLPLFLAPLAAENPQETRCALLWGLVAIGVFYALRFWPASNLTLARIGLDRGDDETLYLSSSPAIAFAGLTLFFAATSREETPLWQRVAFLFFSAACLMTLVAILQRGAILLVLLVLWFYALGRARQSPGFLLVLVAACGAALFFMGDGIGGALETVWRKTLLVGDNARFAELASVREALDRNPAQWLSGAGWGAKIFTAASGHAEVRYTHMLIGYVLLKGGMIGLTALFAYLAFLARRYAQLWRDEPLVAAALFPTLFLGLTLYPSFKMLCFGAMLALIATPLQEQNDLQRPYPFYQPRFSAR